MHIEKKTILFLTANPNGTPQLALDEEAREIEQKIRASKYGDELSFETKWAVRPDDLLQYLNQYRPHIVHFSGHGSVSEEIILLDCDRNAKPVSAAAVKQLFTTLRDNIRVVVLNACYSHMQAKAITEMIDCTIGMKKAIGDAAAIKFAASFYRALGFGRSVKEAFEQGKTALMLEGILEEDTPELLVRAGVDPAKVILANIADSSPRPGAMPVIPVSSSPHHSSRISYYDSNEEQNPFASWINFSSVGNFKRRITVVTLADGQRTAIRIEALNDERVGVNKSFPVRRGVILFDYKVECSKSDGQNIFFYAIPMQETDHRRSGLIEVGTDTQDDPRNEFSPSRFRYSVPHAHYSDGKWHHHKLDFNFDDVPEAFYTIFGPRINEGATHPGTGAVLIANVQLFDKQP